MATAAAIGIEGQHTDEWDGNGVLKTMIFLMTMKTTINKKYNKRGWMQHSSPLTCCSGLRRISGEPPLTGTNNGGGVALENEDVEDDNVEDNGNGCGD
jgi:hypothetical protein